MKPFVLDIPRCMLDSCLYNDIEYLDSRLYKADFGYVQIGAFNKYAYVVDEIPFAQQCDSLIRSITHETAQGKTLLLQLRNLNFSEITKSASETGYCHIRISLYEKEQPDYYPIATLDTLVIVKAMDVTGKLLKNASHAITTFIINNLSSKRLNEVPYSLADIRHIDFFEKRNLKLYNTDICTDGLYLDFTSFANQTPFTDRFTPEFDKNNNLKTIKIPNGQSKLKKVKSHDFYAIVVNGHPYIPGKKNYIPVYKVKDDFKFLNDGNIKTDMAAYAMGGIMGGIISGLIGGNVLFMPVANRQQEKIEMTIDHLNGQFIILPDVPESIQE